MRLNKRIVGSAVGAALLLGGLGATASADPNENPGVPFETKFVAVPTCEKVPVTPNREGYDSSKQALVKSDVFGAPLVRVFDPCPS